MASFNASVAKVKQGIFSFGNWERTSLDVSSDIFRASSRVAPLIRSVKMELVAMAAPQAKVLKVASAILLSSTLMNICMMSPQEALPTVPTPSASEISPTFLGFWKCSIKNFGYLAISYSSIKPFFFVLVLQTLDPLFQFTVELEKHLHNIRQWVRKVTMLEYTFY